MPEARVNEERGVSRPERSLSVTSSAAIYLFTVPALLGYWFYGLHPDRLAGSDFALRFYPISFQLFAQLHILVAAAVLILALIRTLRLSWLPAFVIVCVLSFSAEHLGTGYGVPFGGYSYTGLLGPKVGGRVPALIPVSWFLMAVPSWILARSAFPGVTERGHRVVLGALWLVAWDLALDPAMSFLTPYWLWEEAGPYYGMPWVNLLGWFTTGVILLSALDLLSARAPWWHLGTRWAAGYYVAVLSMPVGMLVAAGAWGAVATTLVGVGACATLSWAVAMQRGYSRRPDRSPEPAQA